ncbi:cytochrome c oxidase subunit II [Micromonospora polyrhachis]|uniref:cytochrome-c oxidase n=1 Tax=Micromonospora polyrhachis TaxID=1282883 RepID=A0A7W7SSE4_9ACTN|nr:cytochrome c oxidase subunit II [Micromonospora polyrhachis]MBB4958830.1 cytochrome c oxidase subunit 2 [Micromonospora polyrhachis]
MSGRRRRLRRYGWWLASAGTLALAGCAAAERQQSALSPKGSRAEAVDGLWRTMLVLGSIVWVVVTAVIVVALVRRNRQKAGTPRRATLYVTLAGAVVPAVVILGLTVQSTLVLRDIDPRDAGDGIVVELTGHQYWWEIRYPASGVVTANEIHMPVGERVAVQLNSADVIHSFWVPELSGKIDLIPGRSNTIWLETDRPGTYWGQCAEFCGIQHANMRIVVIAHEPAAFAEWTRQQLAVPGQPDGDEDPLVARGREVFLSSSCVYCHTVAGTAATGRAGPNLTHLASRDTLAAGILANDRGNLAGWIVDPQSLKPGNRMPGTDIDGDELQALLAYLESLE